MRPQSLLQRMLSHVRLHLGDELGVGAQLEVGRDPLLERGQPNALEPLNLLLEERLELEIGERRPAPEPERLAQQVRALGGLGRARASKQLLEAAEIELRRVDLEHIAVHARLQQSWAEQLPELRDRVLQGRRGRPRWVVAPEPIDDPIRRERLVRVQEQERDKCALVPPGERYLGVSVDDLERSEDPEFEHAQRL